MAVFCHRSAMAFRAVASVPLGLLARRDQQRHRDTRKPPLARVLRAARRGATTAAPWVLVPFATSAFWVRCPTCSAPMVLGRFLRGTNLQAGSSCTWHMEGILCVPFSRASMESFTPQQETLRRRAYQSNGVVCLQQLLPLLEMVPGDVQMIAENPPTLKKGDEILILDADHVEAIVRAFRGAIEAAQVHEVPQAQHQEIQQAKAS